MKFSWSLAKEALVQHARPGLALRGVVHTVLLHEQGLVVQDLLRHPQGRLQDSLLIANVVSKALANKANNCKSSIFSNSPRKSTVKINSKRVFLAYNKLEATGFKATTSPQSAWSACPPPPLPSPQPRQSSISIQEGSAHTIEDIHSSML